MSENKSFWATFPGILTGIAGIITAVGGLLYILYQMEVIGPKQNRPQQPPSEETVVPNVVGLSLREARTKLSNKNLNTVKVRDSTTETNQPETIIKQMPISGRRVPSNTEVTLVVARPKKVYSEGQLVVRGTWSCDLDIGAESQEGTDFWWQQVTEIERYLVPRNGARFSVLGIRDFDSISYSDLIRLSYSSNRINGSAATNNRIPRGTVIAAITSQGRYCKFIIDRYGYNLSIRWVTYEKDS